ncbi:MAG: Hpt domain-containing protein [Bacteroidota bacterium]
MTTLPDLLSHVQAHVRSLLGEDDPEFVVDLVETFAATARQATDDAEAAASVHDTGALAAAAHALKGSASNIGLAALAGRWDMVERSARQGVEAEAHLGRALAETQEAVEVLSEAV